MVHFDNSYARLPDRFFARIAPEEAAAPDLLLVNTALAQELGTADWDAEIYAGNRLPDGADPLAQVYAGQQFGNWVPRLGDGRALLLGEVVTENGRFDIQLKGAGRTPYSRNGDGRAWVGPALREYLISEFMHRLDVPTTRALAVARTGNIVQRERGFPGAVLTRVAASHIRVGTFQYFSSQGDEEALRLLADHVRERHFPEAKEGIIGLYEAIIAAQAKLIAKWMGLGFVHGVMNTDNMAISGETIDYGPCAFIDRFAPNAVFSSIDRHGRYAYDKQAPIAHWNLAQLGSCLIELAREELGTEDQAIEALTETLNGFQDLYLAEHLSVFAAKLGITKWDAGTDGPLISDFLSLLANAQSDFTNSFDAITQGQPETGLTDLAGFADWQDRWLDRVGDAPDRAAMARANPRLIPRTHQIEKAIQASVSGDDSLTHRLAQALAQPFELSEDTQDLRLPPRAEEIVPQTFCGT